MPIKTYPENSDAWGETLNPTEGFWYGIGSYGSISVDPVNKAVGNGSIRSNSNSDGVVGGIFELYDGYEYDATKKNAKFNFLHALEPIKQSGYCGIRLWDKNNNTAQKEFGTKPTGEWETKTFPLGPGQGWTIYDGPFDWTQIKRIEIYAFVLKSDGFSWVDQPYFSYEYEMPTLTIASIPTGKHFTIDGTSGFTPGTFKLTPNAEYSVLMDAQDFSQWEDGSTANPRLITLSEDETKTITAYYGITPPPPGKGTLYCRAFANSDEVAASVQVVGVGTYTTPFSLDLAPATYTLKASYQGQPKQTSATVVEGKITEVSFGFVKTVPPSIDWTPLILAAGVIGAVIVITQIE
jgi:hypothetical protein